MAFPVIYYVIAGIGGGIGGGISSYLFTLLWKRIQIALKRKDIAIFGTIETGKTTLQTYLREGVFIKEHKATKRNTKVKKSCYKLGELELRISEGIDVSGQEEFLREWKEVLKKCDICFYMFDVSKVYNGDKEHISKIEDHMYHINNWRKENAEDSDIAKDKDPDIYMIGAFADKIPEYKTLNKSNIQHFDKKIRDIIKQAFVNISLPSSNFFIGSLTDDINHLSNEKNIETLMSEVLQRISTNK